MYVQEKKLYGAEFFQRREKYAQNRKNSENVQEKSCMYRKKSVRKEKRKGMEQSVSESNESEECSSSLHNVVTFA